jgi:hypothetical protein
MSNQDRLLSDEELRAVVKNQGRYRVAPNIWATLPDHLVESLVKIINTQKRLYAESVVGKKIKHHRNCDMTRFPESEHSYCDCGAKELNDYTAEQRARIK